MNMIQVLEQLVCNKERKAEEAAEASDNLKAAKQRFDSAMTEYRAAVDAVNYIDVLLQAGQFRQLQDK